MPTCAQRIALLALIAIHFVTPQQRHEKLDEALLNESTKVYAAARQANPHRWSGKTRNWTPIAEVNLNAQTAKEQNQLAGLAACASDKLRQLP